MKCPKCSYLGFETSDRCRNCGYDFSLLTDSVAKSRAPDLPLRDTNSTTPSGAHVWDDALRGAPTPPAAEAASKEPLALALDTAVTLPAPGPSVGSSSTVDPVRPTRTAASSLPLFNPGADDEPLIKLPAAPRPPLAVRRTPDKPRLRAVPKQLRRAADPVVETSEPPLAFADEAVLTETAATPVSAPAGQRHAPAVAAIAEASSSVRRLSAALIDHGILLTIDVIVIYFTLKVAALGLGEWRQLPPVPLAAFLGMVKAAYFGAFTLVGGQTIGKMAMQIRVVTEEGEVLDPARVIRRTAVAAISLLAAGIGFVPMLVADDRRGLHDRVARTRVVRA